MKDVTIPNSLKNTIILTHGNELSRDGATMADWIGIIIDLQLNFSTMHSFTTKHIHTLEENNLDKAFNQLSQTSL